MRGFGCGAVLLALFAALAGCAPLGLHSGDFPQPTVRTTLERAGIADRQAEFAAAFCRNLAQLAGPESDDCARWLPAAAPLVAQRAAGRPAAAARPTVVIIPGIFGECVSKQVTPFSQDYRFLEELGYKVQVVGVTGRGSSRQNAQIIHDFFSAPTSTFERAVVIAYSKGVTDFMVAATQPQAARWSGKVGAFVSIAGVVNGTPLASRGEPLYRLLSAVRVKPCEPQDGGGVHSLAYASALPVAQAFALLAKPYPSFSIAAVADGPVNPMLQSFHALLAQVDRRNDGQVLVEDAIVPGSALLGVFRADHWSIVLPFVDSGAPEMLPFSINNRFPRRALVMAVLDFVDR
jgi:hypothetical protein